MRFLMFSAIQLVHYEFWGFIIRTLDILLDFLQTRFDAGLFKIIYCQFTALYIFTYSSIFVTTGWHRDSTTSSPAP